MKAANRATLADRPVLFYWGLLQQPLKLYFVYVLSNPKKPIKESLELINDIAFFLLAVTAAEA